MEGQESVYQLGESFRPGTDFIPRRPKFSDQKTFAFDFFSPEDKSTGHFNLWRRIKHVPISIIGQTDIKLKQKEQSVNNYYFPFKFDLFMLSINY